MAEVGMVPPAIGQQVRRAKATAERLEQHLKPLLQLSQDDISKMTSRQQAELHLVVAQGLAAVHDLFSKVSGTDDDDFDKEKVRIERCARKVRVAGNELELSESSRSLTVDVAAANRFIDAVIPDLDRRPATQQQENTATMRRKLQAEEASKATSSSALTVEEKNASKAAAKLISEVLRSN